jgi:uncharacterized membrane protein
MSILKNYFPLILLLFLVVIPVLTYYIIINYGVDVVLVLLTFVAPVLIGTLLIYKCQFSYTRDKTGTTVKKFIGYNNAMCISGFVFSGIPIIIVLYFIIKKIKEELHYR